MSLLEKITLLCEENNITIGALEKEMGWARSTIRKWEDHSPSVDKVMKLADRFGVSIDWLMGASNDRARSDVGSQDKVVAELIRAYEEEPEMRTLFKTSKGLTIEELRQANQILKTFRGKKDVDA